MRRPRGFARRNGGPVAPGGEEKIARETRVSG